MKTKTIAIILVAILFFILIGGLLFKKLSTNNSISTIKNGQQILKIRMQVITSPFYKDKKIIMITDRNQLDSFDVYLKKDSKPSNVNVAKLNTVYVILEVYKGSEIVKMEVVNSDYTGWVLSIGNSNFVNRGVFEFVKSAISSTR